MVNLQFHDQKQLLDYLNEQNDMLSTKKFILLSTGYHGQKLYESAADQIEKNPKIKAVLIYCEKINLNVIWSSKHSKTNHVYTLNTNTRGLANSIQYVRTS